MTTFLFLFQSFLACRILQGEDKLAEIAMPSSWNKLLPDSLLSIRDEKHRQARRTLTPVRFPFPALLYSMSHKVDMGLSPGSGSNRPWKHLI